MPNPWMAWQPGDDPGALSRVLTRAHDAFLSDGLTSQSLRAVVEDSWRRSLAAGLDPELALAPVLLDDDALRDARHEHPLASAMPLIRRLLVEDAEQDGYLVAVSDAAGRLLWVEGDRRLRGGAEGMNFVPGAGWSEADAGTNAPGTAIATDHPVQIFAAEHFSRGVTRWSCSAAPIHDPHTGAVLGVLDLTGGDDVAAPRALSLVKATVAAVEGELRWRRQDGSALLTPLPEVAGQPSAYQRLDVLGRHAGELRHAAGVQRLSLRHSELLLLLAHARSGLGAEELAVALHPREAATVTVRAELSRLRAVLGDRRLESRPYRLTQPLETDLHVVRDQVIAGRYGAALDAYRGPVLPMSEAPGIVQLREDLHSDLRAALIAVGDPDLLLRLADTPYGRLDHGLWAAALASLPPGSPRQAQVKAHVDRIAVELG